MAGKKSSNPAPPVATTSPVKTPDIDVAQLAAKKALEARGDTAAATNAAVEDEADGTKAATTLASTGQPQRATPTPSAQSQPVRRKPRPVADPASAITAAAGGINAPAILTG